MHAQGRSRLDHPAAGRGADVLIEVRARITAALAIWIGGEGVGRRR